MGVRVRELIRMVERNGWVQVRQRGSHRQFHHPDKPGTVTIAGAPGIEVPPKTLRSIVRQAGLEDQQP